MYCDFGDSKNGINELTAYRTPASHALEIAIQGSAQGNCAFTVENIFKLFGDVDFLESRQFGRLHQILLRFYQSSLEDTLLDGDTDINTVDINNRTPLYWVATRADLITMNLLLRYQADPNKGMPALITFCHQGFLGIANALIDHGANLTAHEKDGYTAFAVSCRHPSRAAMVSRSLEMRIIQILLMNMSKHLCIMHVVKLTSSISYFLACKCKHDKPDF